MKRVMVNLSDETGRVLEEKAGREKRSASGYIALLVEADLTAAGLIGGNGSHQEVLAAVQELGADKALKLLMTAQRRKPKAKVA